VIWLEALGGILLLVANILVVRAVIAADGRGVAPAAPRVRRRRGRPVATLRRAA
jgi:hypothetical protein